MPARLIDIHPGEGANFLRIGGHNFIVSAATIIHLAAAESFFINTHPAGALPYAYLGGALVATFGGLAYEALQRRFGSRLLGAIVIGVLAAILVAVIFEIRMERKVGAYLLLITSSLSGVIASIEYGELWGRLWDVRTARRLLNVSGALGNLGVVLGGLVVAGFSNRIGPGGLMWISVGLLLISLLPAHGTQAGSRPVPVIRKAAWSTLARYRLALMLLASIFVGGLLSTIVRYQLGSVAQEALPPERTPAFFGLMNAALSALLVLFQPLVARPLMGRLAVGSSLGLYPAVLIVAAAASFIHPGLATVTILFVGERLLRLSFSRPSTQVGILPLPDDVRLRTSVAFRNALETVAIAAGSAAMLALPYGLHVHELAVACVILCAAGVAAALFVRGDYVRELASALQARRLKMSEHAIDPAPVETTVRKVLHEQMESGVSEKTVLALRLLEGRCTPDSVGLIRLKWPSWDAWTKMRAVMALSAQPIPEAVTFLRSLGADEPDSVRAALLRSPVTEISDEDLDRLLETTSPMLRAEAMILGLRRGRIDRVRKILEEWIASQDANLRREAAHVIGEARDDTLVHLLPDLASVAPVEVAAAVSLRPTPQFTELCIKLLSDDRTFAKARDSLLKIGSPARQALLGAVRHPDFSAPVLRVLGEIDDPDCRHSLLELLTDPDDELRFHAAKALGRRPLTDETDQLKIASALESELESCRRHAAMKSHSEPLIRDEAAANFETALERIFVLLSLLHPSAPLMRAYLSYVSPDPRQRGFALETLDGILSPAWKKHILPFLEDPTARKRVGLPLDPWEERILEALKRPGNDPVLERAILLKAVSVFKQWRLRDLEALATVSIEPGMATSETRLVLRSGLPVEFERTIVEEVTPEVSPEGVIGIPLAEVYQAIKIQPRCGSLWLRALASRLPRPSGDRPDVSRGPISQGLRRVAQETRIVGSAEPWQRLFFLRSVPIFSELSPERLWLISEIARPVPAEKGEQIVTEGHSGQHFYLICSGEAEVSKGGKPITVLRELEAFGEFSMLTGEPRSATVRAIERCELLRIARHDFLDLIDTNPLLVKSFSKMIAQRVLSTSK